MPILQLCPKPYQSYDYKTNSCVDTCTLSGQLLPNRRNCKSYFKCTDQLKLIEINCTRGGFNPLENKCQASYETFCNDLEIFERIIDKSLPDTYLKFVKPIENLLNSLNLNPLSLLIKYGVKMDPLRSVLLITEYFVTYRKIPPTIYTRIMDQLTQYFPTHLRGIAEKVILRILGSSFVRSKRDLKDQLNEFPQILLLLKQKLDFLIYTVNYGIGYDLFVVNRGFLTIDPDELRKFFSNRYNNFLVTVCGSKEDLCRYLTSIWNEKHSTMLEDALIDFRLPVNYDDQMDNGLIDDTTFDNVINGFKRILLLIDDLLTLLIDNIKSVFLQGLTKELFGMNLRDVLEIAVNFQNDLRDLRV